MSLFMSIIKATNNRIHELYPNSKFVLIEYPMNGCNDLTPEEIKQIKDMGIIYFHIEELMGHDFNDKKYYADKVEHPNYLAYQKMTETLVKKLNL